MIRGIGPVYAKKLLRAFGEAVLDVIEQERHRLREVTGIGPKRAAGIIKAGPSRRSSATSCCSYTPTASARRGRCAFTRPMVADAIQLITENPYRLARDIRGIGFRTADQIAATLGIAKAALIRVRTGVSYTLAEAIDEGHCGRPAEELVSLTQTLLEVAPVS
jgi:exodeoxyribonuclease V alpha subunit